MLIETQFKKIVCINYIVCEWGRSTSVEFWYKSKVKMPKIDNYKMFYKNLAITTKKKPLVDMQKIKRKESKYTARKKPTSYKGILQERKIGTEKLQDRQESIKQTKKMTTVKLYLSVVTLNVCELNSLLRDNVVE